MEIKPTKPIAPNTVETTAKKVVDNLEVEKISKSVVSIEATPNLGSSEGLSSLSSLNISEPVTSATEAEAIAPQAVPLSSKIEILETLASLWEQYFGEGKKSNLIVAIILIVAIPVLATVSSLLDFLNKIPVLPSIFELVGFGYSVWFVYRYLLFANTRKEITDAIANWQKQIFG